jgi:hypothetical protein
MTPKEKARELVEWFINADFNCKECEFEYCDIKCTQLNLHEAKQCAMKCVSEKIITAQKMEAVLTTASSVSQFDPDVPEAIRIWCGQIIDELQQVKQEIEKL